MKQLNEILTADELQIVTKALPRISAVGEMQNGWLRAQFKAGDKVLKVAKVINDANKKARSADTFLTVNRRINGVVLPFRFTNVNENADPETGEITSVSFNFRPLTNDGVFNDIIPDENNNDEIPV